LKKIVTFDPGIGSKKKLAKLKEYTDREIIESLRKREGHVVHYMAVNYLPVIRLMVIQTGGTAEDAKDIFQEGLMIMIEKIDSRHFALTCKFKTLLYCICEKLWKLVLRKKQAASNYLDRLDEQVEDEDMSGKLDDDVCWEMFSSAFETIDKLGQTILKLYWQNLSPMEIAEMLGYSYTYIKKKKCEVQAELTEKVKNHPEYKKIIESGITAKSIIF